MAGNGTIGLEIIEDLPDVDAVVIPWGGGGLACGIAAGMRELKPACKIFGAETATAAAARRVNERQFSSDDRLPAVIRRRHRSKKRIPANVRAAAQSLLDGSITAELSEVAAALRLVAERNRVISEGAGATPVACALSGKAGTGKVVCIVSGGNIDFEKLCSILTGTVAF